MTIPSHSDTPPTVHIPGRLAQEIIEHTREGTPEEICGVLRGRELTAFAVVRGENIAEERIENYTVDPQTLLLQFAFEDMGDEMMGIYHSHPVSEAYPSATDAWNAHYPDSVYFICSLEDDARPVIRAFRMTTHFLDEEYQGLIDELPYYETRPGLFAHYRTENVSPFLSVDAPRLEIGLPFYIVYYQPAEPTAVPELRAVSIVEHPVSQE